MESILIVGVVAAIGVLLVAGGFLLGYHRGIQYAQLPLAREVLPLAGSSAAHEGACAVHKLAGEVGGDRDRKSTRLNSSHANISYAVFCLKKKNTSTVPR